MTDDFKPLYELLDAKHTVAELAERIEQGELKAKAPTPLTVVVQQWSGGDPVAEKLAKPFISRALYPAMHGKDDWEADVKAAIAAELAQKLPLSETAATPAPARDAGDSAE